MFSAQNRQKNKNIQPGPEKQHSYKTKNSASRLWLQPSELPFAEPLNECLCKTFLIKIMKMTSFSCEWLYRWHHIFIPIVSHKDSFCHRGKSKLGIGLFIHELLREPLIHYTDRPKPVNNFFFPLSQTTLFTHGKKLTRALLWPWSEIGKSGPR